MYPMPEFQERDPVKIWEFIRKNPLAMVSAIGEAGIVATHVPLLVDDDPNQLRLRGHVMRKTQHWHGFKQSDEVLVAFTGPDAPVLESWMEERPFGGTWNYMAVHVHGKLNFLAEEQLLEFLRDLKDTFEVDPAAKFDQLSPEYVPSLIKAVEGFEIIATSVEAVFKLSQNRTPSDFENTVSELQKKGGESALVAEEMIARRAEFFPKAH